MYEPDDMFEPMDIDGENNGVYGPPEIRYTETGTLGTRLMGPWPVVSSPQAVRGQ
jgi:hypothetical protein